MVRARIAALAAAMVLGALTLISAQGGAPAPPRNLRIVTAGRSTAPPTPAPTPAPPCKSPCARHAYFDHLVTLPQHYASWSLRSQPQLDSLTNLGTSNYFKYLYGSDPYAQPQDGAKFLKAVDDQVGKGSDSIPGNQQLKMPIGISEGSVLITWDFWYGPEFRTNIGTVNNYKTFQIRQGVDGRWWTIVNRWTLAREEAEVSKIRNTLDAGFDWPAGVRRTQPFMSAGPETPEGEVYPTYYGRWTRYWVEIRLNQPHTAFVEWKALNSTGPTGNSADLTGTWHMLSMWVADEDRPAQRLLYRVPWQMGGSRSNSTVGSFDFEFNTSSVPPQQTGPLVGYGRNVVVLHDYRFPSVPETDSAIFVKPTR